jgi:hypothetical protein
MEPRYQRNPDIVYRPEGLDGAILFEPDSAQVQVLNLTGAYVWEQLDGEQPLPAICAGLARQFDGAPPDPARLYDEVHAFVALLVRLGFAAPVAQEST